MEETSPLIARHGGDVEESDGDSDQEHPLQEEEEAKEKAQQQQSLWARVPWAPLFAALLALLFIASGTLAFSLLEGWDVLDALHFCIVTTTTVGYGTLAPRTVAGRAVAMLYIVVAVGAILVLLSWFADTLLAKQHDALVALLGPDDDDDNVERSDTEVCSSIPTRIGVALAVIVALLALGTGVFASLEHWDVFEALYFSVVTLSTVGFGDLYVVSRGSRIFSVFYVLLGTIAFAVAIAQFSQVWLEARAERRKRELLAFQLTSDVIAEMDTNHDGNVDRAEFYRFLLQRLGKVSRAEFRELDQKFLELDRDGAGVLSKNDLRQSLMVPVVNDGSSEM